MATLSDPNGLIAVACPTTSLCIAGDTNGRALISTNPTGGAKAWPLTDIDGTNAVDAISCPSAKLCVAVDNGGNAVVSTDPTGGKAAWRVVDIDSDYNLLGVSCPSAHLCVAVDESGNVVTSTDPTGSAAAWKSFAADGANPGGFDSVSCPSASLCVAADEYGNLVTSSDPTAGSGAWKLVPVDSPAGGSNDAGDVACPTTHLCLALAGGSAGEFLFTSTDPTGGVSAWTKTTGILAGAPLDSSACVSATLCVVQDVATDIAVSTDPTGGSSAWITAMPVGTPNHETSGLACAGAKLCVAVGEDDVVVSTNP